MRASVATRWGVVAMAAFASLQAPPVRGQDAFSGWAVAGREAVFPLGPQSECFDLEVEAPPQVALRLDVYESTGAPTVSQAAGVGRAVASVCPGSRRPLYAVVVAAESGRLLLERRPASANGAATAPDGEAPPRAEIGPTPRFRASRRLQARIESARELAMQPHGPAIFRELAAGAEVTLPPPVDGRCGLLMVEADDGELDLGELGQVGPGQGLARLVCGAAAVRVRAASTAATLASVWLEPRSESDAPAADRLLIDAALAARGMRGRPVATLVSLGEFQPSPVRLTGAGCHALALSGVGSGELVVTTDQGLPVARSSSAQPVLLAFFCTDGAADMVAWTRTAPSSAPAILFLGSEVSP